jgi:hypothetical protein
MPPLFRKAWKNISLLQDGCATPPVMRSLDLAYRSSVSGPRPPLSHAHNIGVLDDELKFFPIKCCKIATINIVCCTYVIGDGVGTEISL